VRVSAIGELFMCLGGEAKVDLRAALRSAHPERALEAALEVAMQTKPARHNFAIDRAGSAPALARHMSHTGG
jgi:cyclic pyranopterin phosphate synthase